MFEDPGWVLLAELSLSDFLPDQDWREESAAGCLLQSLRDLGMSAECMETIARALVGFAKEAWARTKQGRLEFPGRIQIFCQQNRIEDPNPAKPSRASHTEQGKEQKQKFPDSGAGGWGYFMIARVEVLPSHSSAIPHSCMDLYLYKEGK